MVDNLETQAHSREKSYRPKKMSFLILGFFILILSIIIVLYWASQDKTKTPKATEKQQTTVLANVISLGNNQVIISAGGFVDAKYSSQIVAEVSGRIIAISPQLAVGKILKKGQELVRIDDVNYQTALLSAKANLATAKSQYLQEKARARQGARDAKKLKIKTSDLLLRKPQLMAAKAAIDNAEAQLTLAKDNLNKTIVKAPFNAIVVKRHVSTGDSVMGNTPIARLVDTEAFTVKLTLDANYYPLFTIGNEVALTDPIMKTNYQAKITRFDPTLDKNTRTFGLYVDIKKPLENSKPLLLNTYLQAQIKGKIIANSQWIDNIAISDNQYVWSSDKEQRLVKIPLTLLYRGKQQSLVQFKDPTVNHFIKRPQESFFEGETVHVDLTKVAKDNRNE